MKTKMRKLLVGMLVVMVMSCLSSCAEVSANFSGRDIAIFSTEDCDVKVEIALSTGESIIKSVSVNADEPTKTEALFSKGYLEYLEQEDITIVKVKVIQIEGELTEPWLTIICAPIGITTGAILIHGVEKLHSMWRRKAHKKN